MANPGHDERFSRDVLSWFEAHGRRDLPWQHDPTPYRVWVSEIMLQQTQVATVIPYYVNFMKRFPAVEALASAPIDDVLHHWSGLGYYARARNMHRAARIVCEQYDGVFPGTPEELIDLPGIGRSTAGAVLALSAGKRHPILDGNVKRVLCRYFSVEGWPGQAGVARQLWKIADTMTPVDRVAEYTQAIMDIGATVCRRTRPLCDACPLAERCRASRTGMQGNYPTSRPKRDRPVRHTTMLLAVNNSGHVLLGRRNLDGLWGGLWSLPELLEGCDARTWCRDTLGCQIADEAVLADVRHGFTHFILDVTPHIVRIDDEVAIVMDDENWLWYNPRSPARVGLAAIVKKLIASLPETAEV
jgi:A/G-specific adenine glycosylase